MLQLGSNVALGLRYRNFQGAKFVKNRNKLSELIFMTDAQTSGTACHSMGIVHAPSDQPCAIMLSATASTVRCLILPSEPWIGFLSNLC